jgi:hypothetical protein
VMGGLWNSRRSAVARGQTRLCYTGTLVGEIAPGIVRLTIPAIPGLAAVKMVRNSSRNSKFAIPGTWGSSEWGALSYSQDPKSYSCRLQV